MYYSSGNYEAFARPEKPEGVDRKSAYIVGSGLAALSAACFLVRDGQMKGEHIHILEKGTHPRRRLRRLSTTRRLGYVMRGGREMDNHFEVHVGPVPLHSVHRDRGRERAGRVLLAEQEGPQLLACAVPPSTAGEDAHTDGKFALSDKAAMEIMQAVLHAGRGAVRQDASPTVFDDEVLNSNFWLYWRTMFAFENWHSALEMKLYIKRYHPPHRRPARFYGPALHQVQPVRVHDPAHGQVPGSPRRAVPLRRARCDNVRVRHPAAAKKLATQHRLPARTARRTPSTSPRTTWCSSPTAAASRTPPWAARTSRAAVQTRDQTARAAAGTLWQQDRRAGPGLRPPGEVLLATPEQSNWDERHRHHAGSAASSRTSRRSASATRSPARWSPAASSR